MYIYDISFIQAQKLNMHITVQLATALKLGRVILVTFSPGHPGPTRFTNYLGQTRIGSREK